MVENLVIHYQSAYLAVCLYPAVLDHFRVQNLNQFQIQLDDLQI